MYRALRFPMIRLLAALSVLVTWVPAHAQIIRPTVLVIPGGTGLFSMFMECVTHYQSQGLTLQQATGQCMALGVTRLSGSSGYGLASQFVAGDSSFGASAVQCSSLGLNPEISDIVNRQPDPNYPPLDQPLPNLVDPFDIKYESYMRLVEMLMIDFVQEIGALRDQKKQTTDVTQQQIIQDKIDGLEALAQGFFDQTALDWYRGTLAEYKKWRDEHPPSEPGDYPLPTPGDPQYANVSPDAVSACNQMREFTHECQLAGWKTANCQIFLDRLSGCGDPTITDPSPEEERECKAKPIDSETIKRIAFLSCSKNTKPVPGSDPCSGLIGDASIYHFSYGKLNPNQPICSNPFAYTTAESCTGTFSVIVASEEMVNDAIKEANERLGGPIFILPIPTPSNPVTTEGCYPGLPGC
jgi:hypothetical protein